MSHAGARSLTATQRDTLRQLVGDGRQPKEIAAELGFSLRTAQRAIAELGIHTHIWQGLGFVGADPPRVVQSCSCGKARSVYALDE